MYALGWNLTLRMDPRIRSLVAISQIQDHVVQLVKRPTSDRLIAGSIPTTGNRSLAMCGAPAIWPET
jgi:hypothetical protein